MADADPIGSSNMDLSSRKSDDAHFFGLKWNVSFSRDLRELWSGSCPLDRDLGARLNRSFRMARDDFRATFFLAYGTLKGSPGMMKERSRCEGF